MMLYQFHSADMVHDMAQNRLIVARKGTNAPASRSRAAVRRAPYISFASVLRVLEAFRAFRPRDRDARQLIEDMDKPGAAHRIATLRFLGLLDADSMPTPAMTSMVSAIGTAAWPDVLALTIRNAFQPLFALDLADMTLTQFVAAFAQHYAGSETVLRKSRAFFVHAAIQAKVPLSSDLVRASKPRSGDRVAALRRHERSASTARSGDRSGSAAHGGKPEEQSPSLAVRLLSELDTHAMDDNVRQAFWTLLRHIKDQHL
jgi:hypothetical protein